MRRVAIVGGGLSGLATAYFLMKEAGAAGLDIDLSLWEAEGRSGGKISTLSQDGFRCETGPNGFLDNVPQTLDLVEELGLGKRLLKSSDRARRRFLFSGGRLHQLPESPQAFLRSNLLTIRGRLRIVGEFLVRAKASLHGEDETVASFIRRRLGTEALEKLIDPMVSGIYAGDPEIMSMNSCFPRVVALERQYGGMIRGMIGKQKEARAAGRSGPSGAGPGGTLMSFESGLQELIDALSTRLGGRLHTARPAVSLTPSSQEKGSYVLSMEGGEAVSADAVVLATPAYAAARILGELDGEAARELDGIPYSAVSVVHFGYGSPPSGHDLEGFGFLVPSREKRRILGNLWTSSIFSNRAPQGQALLTSMTGGARDSRTPMLPDDELAKVVEHELESIMGFTEAPTLRKIIRWEKAIPQYRAGHEARLGRIGERTGNHDGLFLVGNAYRGIGVNDCVKAAAKIAPDVLAYLGGRS